MRPAVFYDPTGRRSRWSKRVLAALLFVVIAAAVAFATTLVATPHTRDLALPLSQPRAIAMRGMKARTSASWLPHSTGADPHTPVSVGFYLPDDEASIASLRRHVAGLDWVVPALITVAGPTHAIHQVADPPFDRMIKAMPHPPRVLPMVQNYANEAWDADGAAALLADPRARQAFATRLSAWVANRGDSGLVMDFESLPDASRASYLLLLKDLRRALPKSAILAVTVPAEEPAGSLAALTRVADRVILMAYDQHWQGAEPGPIAAQGWFIQQVQAALRVVGRDRLIVALGSYGYDWHGGQTDALSIEEAWLAAHDSEATVGFDKASGNAGFAFDEDGQRHVVWMLDAAASWNQMVALKQLGIDDVALWRLGSEDPGFWDDLAAFRTGGLPDLSTPRSPFSGSAEVAPLMPKFPSG